MTAYDTRNGEEIPLTNFPRTPQVGELIRWIDKNGDFLQYQVTRVVHQVNYHGDYDASICMVPHEDTTHPMETMG